MDCIAQHQHHADVICKCSIQNGTQFSCGLAYGLHFAVYEYGNVLTSTVVTSSKFEKYKYGLAVRTALRVFCETILSPDFAHIITAQRPLSKDSRVLFFSTLSIS